MKNLLPTFIVLILFYIVYGLFLSRYSIEVYPRELRQDNPPGFYDYRGAINVHSLLSTGGATQKKIIEAAQKSGLNFLIFTDLNQEKLTERLDGYHDEVLTITGGEYSYLNSRLLLLEAPESFDFQGVGETQVFLADVLSQSEFETADPFVILAHPSKPKFHWAHDYPPGLRGMEVINLKLVWQKAWLEQRASFFWTILTIPFNEQLALLRLFQNPEEDLRLWDRLNETQSVVGFLGADAESRIRISESLWIPFPSYESLFAMGSNHILLKSELTGNAKADRHKILMALEKGQFYFSLDLIGNPKGFNAYLRDGTGQISMMGSQVKWRKDLEIVVELPNKPNVPFDIDIYRNNTRIATSNSLLTRLALHEPGVYRVVVRVIPTFPIPDGKKWVPWIFSNPFRVE